jgi:hypothetical protein
VRSTKWEIRIGKCDVLSTNCQRSKAKSQPSTVKSQRSRVKSQPSTVNRQRSRCQRSRVKSQKSTVNGQESKVKSQPSKPITLDLLDKGSGAFGGDQQDKCDSKQSSVQMGVVVDGVVLVFSFEIGIQQKECSQYKTGQT